MDMCYLACAYRTPSGYCGNTGGAATCPHRQKKQTNADRIRAMTDEELADYIWKLQNTKERRSTNGWLDWLIDEVDDDTDRE